MPKTLSHAAYAGLMMRTGLVLLSITLGMISAGHTESTAPLPPELWEKPRTLEDFQTLLQRSPFSLPTAEESSPLAERYALTGIVTIGGVEEIFVFDRTDQSREMLTRTPNTKNMSLVTLIREGSALPQKATIRVGAVTGTIGYLEATPQQQIQPAALQAPGPPATVKQLGVKLPPLPLPPGAINTGQSPVIAPQTHRIIRRPMVTPPQP